MAAIWDRSRAAANGGCAQHSLAGRPHAEQANDEGLARLVFKACRIEMEAPVHARNNVAMLVRSAEVRREKLCNARELQLTHNGQQRHGWLKTSWMENEMVGWRMNRDRGRPTREPSS